MDTTYTAPSAGVYYLTGGNDGNDISGLPTPEYPMDNG